MKTRDFVLSGLMAALMCVSAFIRIPLFFTPIPMTLQMAVALISGVLLGPKNGAVSMLIYLLLGTMGLPVFAGMNAGLGYVCGPTGGFILGFIPCAFAAGLFAQQFYRYNLSATSQLMVLIAAFLCGSTILYLFGAVHFALLQGVSIFQSLTLTVFPFVGIDLIKILGGALVANQVKRSLSLNFM